MAKVQLTQEGKVQPDPKPITGDPALLLAGTVVTYKTDDTATLACRKSDDSGWWCLEGGGLSDTVLEAGDWLIVSEPKKPVLYRPKGWEPA